MANLQIGRDVRGLISNRSRNGGLPSNPVPLLDRIVPDKITKSNHRFGLKRFINLPGSTVAPLPIASPKNFRVAPPEIPFGNRPSRNLGGVFHNVQDILSLHTSVLQSNQIPYSVLRQLQDRANPTIDHGTRIRGVISSAKNIVNYINPPKV